jgi:hypothetical protein
LNASLYLLLISYLAFLFPIALYLIVLGLINQRRNPTMVSGVADALGLLLALSGVLLVSGPVMIRLGYIRNVVHQADDIEPFADIWLRWLIVWILYYGVLVGGVAALLWIRRSKTVLYNVDPEQFDLLLQRTLEKLGLTHVRVGRTIFLAPAQPPAAQEPSLATAVTADNVVLSPPRRPSASHAGSSVRTEIQGELRVEVLPALCNVTLHWRSSGPSPRAEIENAIRNNLDECQAVDNPSATWLLGFGSILLGTVFLVIVFLMLAVFLHR